MLVCRDQSCYSRSRLLRPNGGSVVEIPLTRGHVALIDDDDADLVLAHKWCAINPGRSWYAMCRKRGSNEPVLLHQLILPVARGLTVDHINGDGLDNRRGNLRVATRRQQQWNRRAKRGKRFKGVVWMRDGKLTGGGRWAACIHLSDGRVLRRYAKTEEAAAMYYNLFAQEHFGDFARLNEVPT